MDLAAWVLRHNLFEKYQIRRYSPSVSLLYILAERNLPTLIRVELERLPHMDIRGERHAYPIRAAIAQKNKTAIQELLRPAHRRGDSLENTSTSAIQPCDALFDVAEFVLEHKEELLSLKKEPLTLWAFGRGQFALLDALLATEKVNLICQGPILFPLGARKHHRTEIFSLICQAPFSVQKGKSLLRVSLDLARSRARFVTGISSDNSPDPTLHASQFNTTVRPATISKCLEWAQKRDYRVLSRHLIWQYVLEHETAFKRLDDSSTRWMEPLCADDDFSLLFSKHIRHGLDLSDYHWICLLGHCS